MKRRSFLLGTSALAFSKLANSQPQPVHALPPAFDPSYSHLPSHEQQIAPLSPEALHAQGTARSVSGLPVTGLPLDLQVDDEEIVELIKSAGIVGVSYAIAVHRQLVATRGFGYLCSHARIPATPTAPAYLGSITKPICAMAALNLVNASRLNLDDKVVRVLPMEPLLKPGEKRQPEIDHVTVRMLLTHTSGLFNTVEQLFDRPYYKQLAAQGKLHLVHGDISQYDLVRRGMSVPFVSTPGTAFNYSGQGLQVLGRIVERISGQRLDKFVSTDVMKTLGVKHHACLSYLDRHVWSEIAAGNAEASHTFIPSPYSEQAKKCVSWHHKNPEAPIYGNHWGQADSCGSSMLSAVDLLRFVTFCMDPLAKGLQAEVFTPPPGKPGSNGLGWGVSTHSGKRQWGYGGAWGGIRANCESQANGVHYAVLGVCDQDEAFGKIVKRVAQLGHKLRDQSHVIGWNQYGFPSA